MIEVNPLEEKKLLVDRFFFHGDLTYKYKPGLNIPYSSVPAAILGAYFKISLACELKDKIELAEKAIDSNEWEKKNQLEKDISWILNDSSKMDELIERIAEKLGFEDVETLLKKFEGKSIWPVRDFHGYYLTVSGDGKVIMGNDWVERGKAIQAALDQRGRSVYGLLKAFLEHGYKLADPTSILGVRWVILKGDAERLIDFEARVIVHDFVLLEGYRVIFDSGSRKESRKFLPPETFPLVKEYLQKNEAINRCL
jgi:hypothetical protein